MAELESLPPDQRAAVQLLLKQGQTYEQLAELLAIEPDAVRRRAHAALEALGPESGLRLDSDRREQVADYLLGQQTVAERESTRDYLVESPEARAWGRALADALRPLAPEAVPEVPDEGRAPAPTAAEEEERAPYALAPEEAPRASRLGGALLLGGLAIVVAVVVILLASGGGDKKGGGTAARTGPVTQTTTQGQGTSQPVAQINLLPPGGGTQSVGLAQVFRRGQDRAIVMAAQGVGPGTYALWLYNSASDARLLGFVPQRVGRDGRFTTQGVLPREASRFRQLVVTRERVSRNTRRPPTRPGQVVLQGRLQLG